MLQRNKNVNVGEASPRNSGSQGSCEVPLSVLPDISPARGEIIPVARIQLAETVPKKANTAPLAISTHAGEMSGRTERGTSREK